MELNEERARKENPVSRRPFSQSKGKVELSAAIQGTLEERDIIVREIHGVYSSMNTIKAFCRHPREIRQGSQK